MGDSVQNGHELAGATAQIHGAYSPSFGAMAWLVDCSSIDLWCPMIKFAHIGIQKTGSTWLQTGFFRYHPDLEIIGAGVRSRPLSKIIQEIYDTPQGEFICDEWLKRFERELGVLRARGIFGDPNSLVGISNEQLSGHLFDGDACSVIAPRLRNLFGQIKIILVLRHPISFLRSGYIQHVKSGGCTQSFERFLSGIRRRYSISRRIDFNRLINEYAEVFGREKMLVLPYEFLRDDEEEFLKTIIEFLELRRAGISNLEGRSTRKNESISIGMLLSLRQINRVDRFIDFVSGRRKQRFLSRSLRRSIALLHLPRLFPDIPPLEFRALWEFPEFKSILKDENYRIWSGSLAKYNYTFGKG